MNIKKLKCLINGHHYETTAISEEIDENNQATFTEVCRDCGQTVYLKVPYQVLQTYQALKMHEIKESVK